MTALERRASRWNPPALTLAVMLFAACTHTTPNPAKVEAQLAERLGAEGVSAVAVRATDADQFTGTAMHADGTVWTVTASVTRGKLRHESHSTVTKQNTDASGSISTSKSESVVSGSIPYDG